MPNQHRVKGESSSSRHLTDKETQARAIRPKQIPKNGPDPFTPRHQRLGEEFLDEEADREPRQSAGAERRPKTEFLRRLSYLHESQWHRYGLRDIRTHALAWEKLLRGSLKRQGNWDFDVLRCRVRKLKQLQSALGDDLHDPFADDVEKEMVERRYRTIGIIICLAEIGEALDAVANLLAVELRGRPKADFLESAISSLASTLISRSVEVAAMAAEVAFARAVAEERQVSKRRHKGRKKTLTDEMSAVGIKRIDELLEAGAPDRVAETAAAELRVSHGYTGGWRTLHNAWKNAQKSPEAKVGEIADLVGKNLQKAVKNMERERSYSNFSNTPLEGACIALREAKIE